MSARNAKIVLCTVRGVVLRNVRENAKQRTATSLCSTLCVKIGHLSLAKVGPFLRKVRFSLCNNEISLFSHMDILANA